MTDPPKTLLRGHRLRHRRGPAHAASPAPAGAGVRRPQGLRRPAAGVAPAVLGAARHVHAGPRRRGWRPAPRQGQISLPAAVVAPGLMVLAIILFMGAVSGAHLNPAVSFAFALRGDFPWKRLPGYVIVQLLGATLACLFLLAVFGNVEHRGDAARAGLRELAGLLDGGRADRDPGQRHPRHRLGGAERRRDRGARGRRLHRPRRPLVGSGQRHLDEPGALLRPRPGQRRLHHYWVYVVGPLVGALLAVGCAIVLRGRAAARSPRAAGSGVLDPGSSAGAAEAGPRDRRRRRDPSADIPRKDGSGSA